MMRRESFSFLASRGDSPFLVSLDLLMKMIGRQTGNRYRDRGHPCKVVPDTGKSEEDVLRPQ